MSARLTDNGTVIPGTTMISHCHGGGVGIVTITGSSITQLANNDVVDIQITNQSSNNAIVVSWLTLTLMELPAP